VIGQPFGDVGAQLLDRVGEREPGQLGVQRHHRQRGDPVVGHLRRGHAEPSGGRDVVRAQRGVVGAGDDDDRRGPVAAGEL